MRSASPQQGSKARPTPRGSSPASMVAVVAAPPLEARGDTAIGCAPATSPVAPGEDPRAGTGPFGRDDPLPDPPGGRA
jgi:hypothetical protein